MLYAIANLEHEVDMLNARPIFQHDESPTSVLLRAASLNGWHGVQPLLRVCSPRPPIFASALRCRIRFAEYASILGIAVPDPETFETIKISGATCRSILRPDSQLPEWAFRPHGGAVCPACLSEDAAPYLRAIWDVQIYRTCATHGLLLVDRCEACGQSLSWKRRAPHLCECGHDLREQTTNSGNIHAAKEVRVLIWERRHETLGRVARVFRASVEALEIEDDPALQDRVLTELLTGEIELVSFLKIHVERRANYLHPRLILLPFLRENALVDIANRVLRESRRIPIAEEPMQPIGGALSQRDTMTALGNRETKVPSGFFLHDLLQTAPLTRRQGAGLFQEGITRASCDLILRKLWRSPAHQTEETRARPPVMSFIDFMIHLINNPRDCAGYDLAGGLYSLRMNGQRLKPTRLKSVEFERTEFSTLDATANALGIDKYLVPSLATRGWLKMIIDPVNPPAKMICNASIKKFNSNYICSPKLARDHNLRPSAHFTRRLKSFGIVPVGGPGVDGAKVYVLQRRDLDGIDFQRSRPGIIMISGARLCDSRDAGIQSRIEAISMSEAARVLSITVPEAKVLVNRGFLQKVESPSIDVMILAGSFRSFLKKWNDKKLVELDSAAALLSETKMQFVMRWVATGIVKTVDLGLRICVHSVDISWLQGIKQRFILAPDCAKLWRIGRFALPNMEVRGLISSTRMGDGGKARLYLREDVERLLGPQPYT